MMRGPIPDRRQSTNSTSVGARPDRSSAARQRRVEGGRAGGRTLTGLGIEPVAMRAVVPTYLWRFRKSGQFKTGLA